MVVLPLRFTPCTGLLWVLCTALLLIGGGAAHAQPIPDSSFVFVPVKPFDPNWTSGTDEPPEAQNCELTPLDGPRPYLIGLPAALEAAGRRELTYYGLVTTFLWAEREADPAHAPALRRLVEDYRCFDFTANLVLLALEASGEPSEYFVRYAQDWRRDDRLADWAMNALSVRADPAVAPALRGVALEAPNRGPYGRNLQQSFGTYLGGLSTWERFHRFPVDAQLLYVVWNAAFASVAGHMPTEDYPDPYLFQSAPGNSSPNVIPRRALRLLSESHPSAMEDAMSVAADSARSILTWRGVPPEERARHAENIRRYPRELAFGGERVPTFPGLTVTSASTESQKRGVAPSVCVEAPEQVSSPIPRFIPPYPEGTLLAVYSYTSGLPENARVPYGPDNSLDAPVVKRLPFEPLPPEVFFPDGSRTYSGLLRPRSFRVAFRPGESVSWTLLGQTVTATAETPRCEP